MNNEQAAAREPDIWDVLQKLDKQDMMIDASALHQLGSISHKQHVRLITLIKSSDMENHTVAREIIKNKLLSL